MRDIDWFPPVPAPWGMALTTQARVLTRNRTCDFLVPGMLPNQLSPPARAGLGCPPLMCPPASQLCSWVSVSLSSPSLPGA